MRFMVYFDGHKWNVKEENFFIAQGGRKQQWGKEWHLIEAEGTEHARLKAEVLDFCGVEPQHFLLYDDSSAYKKFLERTT